jgi:hypothetical protein
MVYALTHARQWPAHCPDIMRNQIAQKLRWIGGGLAL